MLPVAGPETLSMVTEDGTRLDADVWRPAGSGGAHPVLLMRQPYGRRIASTLVYAHPAWYAAHGYVVAIQDVRGTGSSAGRFRLFAHEEADGAQAVRWAAGLPGSNGKVGMYGFSYQAVTQFLALAGGAPLHALAPAMAGWDMRSDWAWEGGAFCFAAGLGWGAQMGWIRARHEGDEDAAAAFEAVARALPLSTPGRAMPDAMARHARHTHYADWLAHPAPGPYWDAFAPRARLAGRAAADVPMLHVGGWYDGMLMGTLDAHRAMRARSGAEQPLVVGPWTHQPWGRRVGAVDFGTGASSPIDRMQVAFFDRHLKGVGEALPPLTLFDLGTRAWFEAADWPETRREARFAAGNGLAAATTTGGTLARTPSAPGVERWVHDPWRPVPTLGGHNAQPGGMQDRAAIDDRADVACFTGPPLDAPLRLCGRLEAELWVDADTPSFDVSAVLGMVDGQGRCWNLSQGHARFTGGGDAPRRVAMRAVAATVPAGHALRLSLAGASFPAFPVNPGTGAGPADARASDEQVITLRLRHGVGTPSCVWLPVVPAS